MSGQEESQVLKMSEPEIESEPTEPKKFVYSVKNKADFDVKMKEALETGKLVCCDFYADWCGPCKAIAPAIEALAEKNPLVTFIKVDVDEVEEVAQVYGITCMPTFIFFKNGEKLSVVEGASESKVKQAIEDLADY